MSASKGEKDLLESVSRTYWKRFRLGLKGERDETRLTRDKPESGMQIFEGQCASKVLQAVISVEVGGGDLCSSKEKRVIDALETMEVPENSHVGIGASPQKKVVGSIAKQKCIYTNPHSVCNKQ